MNGAAEFLIKVTIVFATGLILVAAARRAGPSLRHTILFATLLSAALLPLLIALSPSWDVALIPANAAANAVQPVASQRSSTSSPSSNASRIGIAFRSAASPGNAPAPTIDLSHLVATPATSLFGSRSGRWSPAVVILAAYLFGVGGVLVWLLIGRLRLRRIGKDAWPLNDAAWTSLLGVECKNSGVDKRVRLLSSPVVSTPLTWGWRAPIIMFPEDAIDWDESHRRIVLRHELAHIARNDSLTQVAAGFICALYWFHPLVWVTERRLRSECERACDELVVSMGTEPADYASHLLQVARSARAFGAPGFLSVAMARPSQLEGRLLAVLNGTRERVAMPPLARLIATALAILLFLPLAAFRAVPVVRVITQRNESSVTPVATTTLPRSASAHTTEQQINQVRASNADESKNAASAQDPGAFPFADSTFTLSAPASNGGTLSLDLRTGGEVIVTGWDQPQVVVHGRLSGPSWRQTRVDLQRENGSVRLVSEFERGTRVQSSSHTFEINVPRNYNITLSSAGGGISISDVIGNLSGETGGGGIDISRAAGKAHLATGGGDVRVVDSRLYGEVSTGGGTVRIERVDGNLKGYSGSGRVDIIPDSGLSTTTSTGESTSFSSGGGATTINNTNNDDYRGQARGFGGRGVRLSRAGGDISEASAPNGGRFTTGGGSIRIGPSSGDLLVETGGGSIDIGPARGSVKATTGAGNVTIELVGANGHEVDVVSGTGNATLFVPSDLNATLELETAYTNNAKRKTEIVSDFALHPTETANWDAHEGTPRRYIRARQDLGTGGPVIRVRVVNGDIFLRKR